MAASSSKDSLLMLRPRKARRKAERNRALHTATTIRSESLLWKRNDRESVDRREVLAALDPFFAREDSRRELNQARKHIEHRDRPPLGSPAGAEALAV